MQTNYKADNNLFGGLRVNNEKSLQQHSLNEFRNFRCLWCSPLATPSCFLMVFSSLRLCFPWLNLCLCCSAAAEHESCSVTRFLDLLHGHKSHKIPSTTCAILAGRATGKWKRSRHFLG